MSCSDSEVPASNNHDNDRPYITRLLCQVRDVSDPNEADPRSASSAVDLADEVS